MKINTTATVANELNISPQRVRQLIEELGLKPMRVGKAIVLTDEEVSRLEARNKQVGRPTTKKAK